MTLRSLGAGEVNRFRCVKQHIITQHERSTRHGVMNDCIGRQLSIQSSERLTSYFRDKLSLRNH